MLLKSLVFLILFFGLIVNNGVIQAQAEAVSIRDAAQGKRISFKVSGLWHPDNPSDYNGADGMYFGRCMQIMVKNISADTLFLILPRGMILLCEDTTVQDMLVTQSLEFRVFPRETKLYSFYAMCTEIHDDMPTLKTSYHFGPMCDSLMQKLAFVIDRGFMQNMAGQHALWAYTDEAKFSELKKYGATAESITISLKLLHEAGIQNNLASELHYEGSVDMVQARDSLIRRLNKRLVVLNSEIEKQQNKILLDPLWVYGGLALILVFGAGSALLVLKNPTRKKDQA